MTEPSDFIRNIIKEDMESEKNNGAVITRFPPEPNGYLHIGHAKSICLNFGIAEENRGGTCHLRFDDTNPAKEDAEYVEAIKSDIKWLGFDPKDHIYHASDYFDKLYECALKLIKEGKAYVCNLNAEQIREYRGTLTAPGKNSPYRDRSIEENLALFEIMKNGDIKEGEAVLRAKVDMNSPNLNMRDPVIYRIKHDSHYRTGKKWHIYPMYDFTHCLSDSFENITHSLCTLEFEDHRPLYDWLLDQLKSECHPKQIEFARLNLTYTVLSKRKLNMLAADNVVAGWDDPRMPTISGIRRRGYTPASIKDFCSRIGVAKRDSIVDLALLEHCIREELNRTTKRVMAVINPIKVIIDNYVEGKTEYFDSPYHPTDKSFGFRRVPFSRELYIEREDFMEDPPKKFFRLAPGKEVRLRYAYFVKCTDVVYDENGEIKEIHCVYDPTTRGGSAPDGRKVKGTIHWVSAEHAISAEVRLYNNLFTLPNPEDKKSVADFRDCINPNSLVIVKSAKLEPSLADTLPEEKCQFERLGYFCADSKDSKEGAPVFNRTVPLKDTWAKMQKNKFR